jgi:hypothetical protein
MLLPYLRPFNIILISRTLKLFMRELFGAKILGRKIFTSHTKLSFKLLFFLFFFFFEFFLSSNVLKKRKERIKRLSVKHYFICRKSYALL